MDFEQRKINKLRKKILIGGPAVIFITFLIVVTLQENAPFGLLIPILTIVWFVGFIGIIRLFYLQIKRWFE